MLDKNLAPGAFEARLYEGWEQGGAFACDPGSNAVPYTIMIPPPNVTGSLHTGHALTFTLQDTLIRWRRMQGRDALWQPGTDHAGIATQMVVERLLAAAGEDRRAVGREAFVERIWRWKAESGGTITRQLRRLGASLDWQRERFTMDEGLSAAVREVFVTLHRQGLIYRDRRLVNWDPKLLTAISDLEVESREVKGSLWTLRYPIEGAPDRHILVATTRPETMLGDTAVAVNPDDPRFADLIGKRAILPLVGRAIPILADAHSDPEKGTGAVKITPAHDFDDFEVGKRHDLPMPSMLDAEARIDLAEIEAALRPVPGVADPAFVRALAGQDRFPARRAIVARLEELGLLEKTEPHTHQVPHGDRGGVPVEPRLTWQWYCDAATLAKPAIAAVESGRTVFVPRQWENTFFAWMRDIQPWCISRQLWWGHRIPAWHGPDGAIFVERTEAEAIAAARAHYGEDRPLTRDEDVLDTWFSSALWPFSTLGWPERTRELARYYPGDVLVTGFDIIFFWVARMMMMGLHFMGEVPFRTVCIHGLVRDERGQKMSKSKGNTIDPLELIEEYGADALRFANLALAGPGRDVKLGRKRVEDARSFVTKLWNAARFLEMNGVRPDPGWDPTQAETPLARWILDAANRATEDATAALEAYRFDDYAAACYRFVWNTFCDWFIEFAKPVLNGPDGCAKTEAKGAAQHVLGTILRLLHPAMPFVTEELWDGFGYGEPGSLIRAVWPEPSTVREPETARAEFNETIDFIVTIRSARSDLNIAPNVVLPITRYTQVYDFDQEQRIPTEPSIRRNGVFVERLARVENRASQPVGQREVAVDHARSAIQLTMEHGVYMLEVGNNIDLKKEASRLQRECDKAEGEQRKISLKLESADFLAKAPEEVVEENRERLAAARAEVVRLKGALARISG
jgi:valyl-tRNA synthetase